FGSLGHTGKGHGSDTAVMLGLEGQDPENVDPDAIPARITRIAEEASVRLSDRELVAFSPREDIVFHRRQILPKHPNGMRFHALDSVGNDLATRVYYSVGGGFVVNDDGHAGDSVSMR